MLEKTVAMEMVTANWRNNSPIMPPMNTDTDRRILYPAIEANHTSYLEVSGGHELYYEESGNPHGKPAVFLHGGPGGGCTEKMVGFLMNCWY